MSTTLPFVFFTERRLVRLTGRRAQTLVAHLREVSGASVFYDTHHLYLSHHFRRPVFYNDFATWTEDALQDTLAGTVGRDRSPRVHRDSSAPRSAPGNHGAACQRQRRRSRLSAGRRVPFLPVTELRDADQSRRGECTRLLPAARAGARLRLGRSTNDFSAWLEARGEKLLAGAIDRLDPYAVSLDQLKVQMIQIVNRHYGGRRPVG